MNYKDLNKIQKDRMKQISVHDYIMEWENPEFMDYLLGSLPQIRRMKDDESITDELSKLNNMLVSYDSFESDKQSFLAEVDNIITKITEKKSSWYGLNRYEIEKYLKIHGFCLISGEGGIGKSYFIKCFEENLEKKNIEHLCLYGKFEKDTSRINVEEAEKI